jgi:predicted HicB family RNase H-like nuclease
MSIKKQLEIPEDLHQRLAVCAALDKISQQDLILEFISEGLDKREQLRKAVEAVEIKE